MRYECIGLFFLRQLKLVLKSKFQRNIPTIIKNKLCKIIIEVQSGGWGKFPVWPSPPWTSGSSTDAGRDPFGLVCEAGRYGEITTRKPETDVRGEGGDGVRTSNRTLLPERNNHRPVIRPRGRIDYE